MGWCSPAEGPPDPQEQRLLRLIANTHSRGAGLLGSVHGAGRGQRAGATSHPSALLPPTPAHPSTDSWGTSPSLTVPTKPLATGTLTHAGHPQDSVRLAQPQCLPGDTAAQGHHTRCQWGVQGCTGRAVGPVWLESSPGTWGTTPLVAPHIPLTPALCARASAGSVRQEVAIPPSLPFFL